MKEFISKHIEELVGTAVGSFTGVSIKLKLANVAFIWSLANDAHTIGLAIITGFAGGFGAFLFKLILKKIRQGKSEK